MVEQRKYDKSGSLDVVCHCFAVRSLEATRWGGFRSTSSRSIATQPIHLSGFLSLSSCVSLLLGQELLTFPFLLGQPCNSRDASGGQPCCHQLVPAPDFASMANSESLMLLIVCVCLIRHSLGLKMACSQI